MCVVTTRSNLNYDDLLSVLNKLRKCVFVATIFYNLFKQKKQFVDFPVKLFVKPIEKRSIQIIDFISFFYLVVVELVKYK